jgi:hypothetical protein
VRLISEDIPTYSRVVAMLILRICDVCDPEAREDAEPLEIGLDGADGEIDLCHVHRMKLDEVMAPYVKAARVVRSPEPVKGRRRRA